MKKLFILLIVPLMVACTADQIYYNTAASANFGISMDAYELGNATTFTDSTLAASGNTIVKWNWNFGVDSSSVSTEQNPTYTYQVAGKFTVKLTVTDNNGLKATSTKDVTIIDPAKAINIIWQKALLGAIENTVSPAMSPDGKTVYMAADQSVTNAYDVKLKAYDAVTGNIKWEFNINDALAALNTGGGVRLIYASPSVGADGSIYVTVRDLKNAGAARKSFMFAVTPTGTLKWNYAFGIDANFNYITPAIDANGKIYVGHLTTAPYVVTILNGTDGTLSSKINLTVGVRSGLALSKTGDLYFCSTSANGCFGFSNTGTQKFMYNTSFATTGGAIAVDGDGTVYTVAELTGGGGIVALNADGSKKWVYSTPGVIQFGGAVIGSDGTIYANGGKAVAGQTSAGVVALNSDGTLKWHFGTTEDVNNGVPLIDNRGYIHIISDNATYYIIRPDGTLFSSAVLGVKTYASPVMDSKGSLFIGIETTVGVSEMFCLTSGAKSYANSVWPMKGQNPQRTGLQK